MGRITLVLGGARSGKSAFAEGLASESPKPVRYIATMLPLDDESRERIRRHRERRDPSWETIEEPDDPELVIGGIEDGTVILECLTLFVSRLIEGRRDDEILSKVRDLVSASRKSGADIIIVSNEVGSGVVPEGSLGRRFRDIAGRANTIVAAAADEVRLLVAGIPMEVKGERSR